MDDDLAEAPHTEGPESEDTGCEAVPAGLVELHEVLEWEAAVRAAAAEAAE